VGNCNEQGTKMYSKVCCIELQRTRYSKVCCIELQRTRYSSVCCIELQRTRYSSVCCIELQRTRYCKVCYKNIMHYSEEHFLIHALYVYLTKMNILRFLISPLVSSNFSYVYCIFIKNILSAI